MQPAATAWLKFISRTTYQINALTAPAQFGKSLLGFVAIAMYFLFERRESIILGVPSIELIADKWERDLLPAIRASRYEKLLPNKGRGSQGGTPNAITFENGARLRFMTAGGGDKSRAGYTARVLIVTEVDGFDETGTTSREANKLEQLFARTQAFGDRRRIFLECTVSTEDGAIWQSISKGTNSRIAIRCQYCREFVSPERIHLQGWREGVDEVDAGEKTYLECPACKARWTEKDRQKANAECHVIHEGQSIDTNGVITGEPKRTRTFGLRVNAANNLFIGLPMLGEAEYKSSISVNEEEQNQAIEQFKWVVPHKPDKEIAAKLTTDAIMRKQSEYDRRICPENGLQGLLIGVDVGKHTLHYVAKAFDTLPRAYTIDYGVKEVMSREMEETSAIRLGLRLLFEELRTNYTRKGEIIHPDMCIVDSGYQTETVYQACQEENNRAIKAGGAPWVFPSKGLGWRSDTNAIYTRPKTKNSQVIEIGDGWHIVSLNGVMLIECHADVWKSRVHSRWEIDKDQPGSILLFKNDERLAHFNYSKHQLAEEKYTQFNAKEGKLITRWRKIRKENHWLDAEAMANVAADVFGIKIERIEQAETPVIAPQQEFIPNPESPFIWQR